MPRLSIAQLFDDNSAKLKLTWVAGRTGGGRSLSSEFIKDSSKGLIGHLNFIHPNWIQVLGATEVDYLGGLDAAVRRSTLEEIATRDLACFIAAGIESIPETLMSVAEGTQTPIFSSPLPSVELMWMLRPYLARALADSTTTHGVFLDVLGMGVLIT